LLDQHGITHIAVHPGFDDAGLEPGGVTPAQWVASLAYLKAWAGVRLPEACEGGGRIVLAADTTCVVEGKMMGTPHTAREAGRMLRAMRGRGHEVLTGVAILDLRGCQGGLGWSADALPAERRTVFVDRATVRLGEISDGEIDAYVRSGGWQGKAGGYNPAERLEAGWPIAFDGDPTSIMGLPMGRVVAAMSALWGSGGSATRE
jgi:septum formation protein